MFNFHKTQLIYTIIVSFQLLHEYRSSSSIEAVQVKLGPWQRPNIESICWRQARRLTEPKFGPAQSLTQNPSLGLTGSPAGVVFTFLSHLRVSSAKILILDRRRICEVEKEEGDVTHSIERALVVLYISSSPHVPPVPTPNCQGSSL